VAVHNNFLLYCFGPLPTINTLPHQTVALRRYGTFAKGTTKSQHSSSSQAGASRLIPKTGLPHKKPRGLELASEHTNHGTHCWHQCSSYRCFGFPCCILWLPRWGRIYRECLRQVIQPREMSRGKQQRSTAVCLLSVHRTCASAARDTILESQLFPTP
jgi:hypothetical protein